MGQPLCLRNRPRRPTRALRGAYREPYGEPFGGTPDRFLERPVRTFLRHRHRRDPLLVLALARARHAAGSERPTEARHRQVGAFEELGVRYLGPVDGHDLETLIPTLNKVRTFHGPILLHVITVKGKGRPYAEADPTHWHSPPLHFDADSGETPERQPGPPSFTSIFA